MREIKFRGFCRGTDAVWRQDPDYIGLNGECFDKVYDELEEDKDYFLVQYTGLKDKNGKEIYEGDIVHMYSVMPGCDIDEIGIVKFIECAFLFEKTDGSNGWSIFNEATEIEVIGNTYENPELLER